MFRLWKRQQDRVRLQLGSLPFQDVAIAGGRRSWGTSVRWSEGVVGHGQEIAPFAALNEGGEGRE